MNTEEQKVVLEVKNLTKEFGDDTAVKNISFDLYDGEFLFVIGPSGCGKTTTLRMIGGYESPSSGEIRVRGQLLNNVPLEKRNIGMVFQSYALFPHMTVQKNVEYGLRMRGVSKLARKKKAAEVLSLVELEDYAARYPAQLSGGQKQRVALARVIALEPDLLLLDEPLANLDKRLRDTMRIELKKLQEKVGITTLYVTHDQEEALTMADRIVVMHDGNILQVGSPKDVYNDPTSQFVAGFLGETSSFQGKARVASDGFNEIVIDEAMIVRPIATNSFQAESSVFVSIRPERIKLSKEKQTQEVNCTTGIIDFVSYLGSHVFYFINILNGTALLKASEPIPHGEASFKVGDFVHAYWQEDNVVCITDK
ncbi:MAG: polyamine ABC transporter ATP-binding protein [Acidiferrobacteraceae bacterium]|nr:polyamine ABC transporter ATP-binding protein [Acidiferrobacteraceae bacterium]